MATQPIVPTGNPLLDNPALKAALIQKMGQVTPSGTPPPMPAPGAQQSAPQIGAPQPSGANDMQPATPPVMPSGTAPHIQAPRGTVEGDEAHRTDLLNHPAALESVYGKVAHSDFGQNHPIAGKILGGLAQIPATVADIGLSGIMPKVGQFVPGTSIQHGERVAGANKQVGEDVGEREKAAQTANEQSLPALHQAQLENAQNKQAETQEHHQSQILEQLHAHGFDQDEKGQIVPLSYDKMSESQQAVHDLKASQEELADASAALKKVQADPNSPQARLAQQRVDNATRSSQTALQRLGLSQQAFNARYKGVDSEGQALPGAMITDEGKPVGSSFSQNVRPTGTERNKADMAGSAKEQLGDIAEIVSKHPTLFGPGYGQSSAFKQWIGSQDPDAQRFVAARTIAGDHLAGTFGGRSEAALDALDTAIGKFKDNPEALKAGLAQLSKANERFLKAGTVRTAGSKAGDETPKEGETKVNSDGDKVVRKGGKWVPAP